MGREGQMKATGAQVLASLMKTAYPQPEDIDQAAKLANPGALVTAALDRVLDPGTRRIAAALVAVIHRLGMTPDQRSRVRTAWHSQPDMLSSKALTLLDILLTEGTPDSLQLVRELSAAQARGWLETRPFRMAVLHGKRSATFQKVYDAMLDLAQTLDPPKERPQAPEGLHRYYLVTATLVDAPQRTMRQFLLADDADWHDVHGAIQDASGSWCHDHMWAIYKGKSGTVVAAGDGDGVAGPQGCVADVVEVGTRQFKYVYDFGDHWQVSVTFATKGVLLAQNCHRILKAGQGAFPPEDCGGMYGMFRLTAKFRDPARDVDAFDEGDWNWNPDAFDLAETKTSFDRPRR
jgi:hypothetical protein